MILVCRTIHSAVIMDPAGMFSFSREEVGRFGGRIASLSQAWLSATDVVGPDRNFRRLLVFGIPKLVGRNVTSCR